MQPKPLRLPTAHSPPNPRQTHHQKPGWPIHRSIIAISGELRRPHSQVHPLLHHPPTKLGCPMSGFSDMGCKQPAQPSSHHSTTSVTEAVCVTTAPARFVEVAVTVIGNDCTALAEV